MGQRIVVDDFCFDVETRYSERIQIFGLDAKAPKWKFQIVDKLRWENQKGCQGLWKKYVKG